ncbi:F25B4.6, partial [Symbiodinium sp. KB8]
VESANAVYRTCVRVLFAAYKVNSIVSIENPARAWTWAALAALVVQFGRDNGCPDFVDWYFNLHDVFFSMCMHGGQRKKDTRLKSSPQIFSSLAAPCDGSHSHEPYGQKREGGSWKFDTAAEAQYPRVLCLRMVKAASQAVAPAMFADTSRRFRLDSLAALGEQTVKHPPLIPEYRQVVWSPTVPPQECKLLPDYSEAQCDVAIDHADVPSWPVPLSSTDLPEHVPLDSSATEKLAWTLLQQKQASRDDILQLVSLLPRPTHSRRQAQASGLSWIAGAYVFSSEVLLHFARGIVFSSLAVFADFAGPEHRDAHNDHRFYNAIVPLSEFQRGGVQDFFIRSYQLWVSFISVGLLIRCVPPIWRGKVQLEVAFTLTEFESIELGGFIILWRSM